jgi:hypothetical protein
MGEGRAVDGRKASRPVCVARPLLTDSPIAFLFKESVRVIAFLPGFASRVEIAVTHSKQTVATFLPGSRIGTSTPRVTHGESAPLAERGRHHQFASFLSGTAPHIEIGVTHSKQTVATFLPGARTGSMAPHFSRAETQSIAPTPSYFANLRSRRMISSLGKGDFDAVPVRTDRSCWIERRGREARGCGRWKGIGS